MLLWLLPALAAAVAPDELRKKMMFTYRRDATSPLFVTKEYPLFSKLNLATDLFESRHDALEPTTVSTHDDMESVTTDVQSSLKLSGSSGAFSATVHSSFDKMHSTKRHTMKSVRSYIFSKWQFNIVPDNLWDYVGEEDQQILLTAPPEHVLDRYGEFYNPGKARYGGVFKSMFSREMSETEDKLAVKAEVEASYGTMGTTASGGVKSTSNKYSMATFLSVTAYGGDASALGGDNVEEVQKKWSDGIEDASMLPTVLRLQPIWELFPNTTDAERSKYGQRRNVLETYFKNLWAQEKNAVPVPDEWATQSCEGNSPPDGWSPHFKWCDNYSRRRRRNDCGWGIRTQYCPDGCKLGSKKLYKDWCNDHGGFHVCRTDPPSQSIANSTEEEALPDITV